MPPDAPPAAAPRTVGNYELLTKIAEGGMGAVYRGKSLTTGEIVAIKIVPAETAKNPILMKRFEQEFKAARLLDHPNVVKAVDFCGTGPNPFLAMEFVDGESLGQRVERGGAVPELEAVHLIGQVCRGLHRAHKIGLIHRDVKPDNILVTKDGVAKLTDMGLVKDVEGELNLTKTGRGLGTPHFMAPEQFRNAKNADVRCDVYSLGATLYMIVTGEVPFAKTSPLDCWMRKVKNDLPEAKHLNPRLSDRVNWAIKRSMSADPKLRPGSCREFLEDVTGRAEATGGHMMVPDEVRDAPLGGGDPAAPPAPPAPDLWYLVYKTPDGVSHTVKGTTESIRQNIRAGTLGDPDGVVVCRSKAGPFAAFKTVVEFRDLVVMAAGPVPANMPYPPAVPAAAAPTGKAGGTVPVLPGRGSHASNPGAVGGFPATPARASATPAYGRSRLPAPHQMAPDPAGPGALEKYLPWVFVAVAAGVAVAAFVIFGR